jgi:hypothetical protein
MTAGTGVGIEHHDPFGLVRIVGKGEGIGRPGVPDPIRHPGVEVVVAEQHEVRPQESGVHLDLVDVGIAGLYLRHPGMGQQQIGAIGAPAAVGLGQGRKCRLHAQHLGHGVDHQAGQRVPLV